MRTSVDLLGMTTPRCGVERGLGFLRITQVEKAGEDHAVARRLRGGLREQWGLGVSPAGRGGGPTRKPPGGRPCPGPPAPRPAPRAVPPAPAPAPRAVALAAAPSGEPAL